MDSQNIQKKIEKIFNEDFALIICVVIAFFLMRWGISWGLGKMYHPDELAMLRPIIDYFVEVGWDTTDWTNTQPLFHTWFIATILKITIGKEAIISFLQSSDLNSLYLIGRKITTFFGIGIIIATYYAAKKLFDKNTAIISAAILSITPILIWNTHYFYNDIPLTFWTAVCIAASAHILKQREPNKIAYIISAITAIFAATTKLTGFYVLIIPLIAHSLNIHYKKENQTQNNIWQEIKSTVKKIISKKSTWILIVSLIMIPFLISPNLIELAQEYQTKFFSHNDSSSPEETIVFKSNSFILTPIIYTVGISLQFILGWPLWISLIISSIIIAMRKNKEDIFLLIITIPFLLIVSITWLKIYFRYLLPLIPLIAIIISAGYFEIRKKVTEFHLKEKTKQKILKIIKISASFVMIYSLIFTLTTTARFQDDTREDASNWINTNLNTGSTIAGQGGFTAVDSPRVNFQKFNIVQTPKTVKELKLQDPTYVVTTTLADNEFTRYSKFPIEEKNDNPVKVQEYIKNKENYKIIKTFQSNYLNKRYYTKLDPYFEGFYISPTIIIYQKQE